MQWKWTHEKERINRRDHGLSFDTAQLAFRDPLAISRVDPHPDGDRWQTLGRAGAVLLFVVHTWPEPGPGAGAGEATGRIISARKATADERRAYEEGEFH